MKVPAWLVASLLVVSVACGHKPPDDPQDYTTRITLARQAKDEEFRKSDDPIPADKKSEFLPLLYYPVDPDYNVAAVLKEAEEKPVFKMPTSSGKLRDMRRVGTLEFTLKGQQYTLGAFTETDLRRLFVPFRDTTAGKDTYAAGRFLDLDRTGTGLYALDFNRAYTPYCYYNASFECPYPPAENQLKIAILAGEKTKPHE